MPLSVLGETEIVLCFENGKLQPDRTRGADSLPAQELLRSLAETAVEDGGRTYVCAELGIGCNPSYSTLTATELVDEKVAGTIHIGLGNNTFMGGTNDADTHLDIVTIPTAILIDEVELTLPARRES